MPFSPQPRKKGIPAGSQDGIKKPSCGHTDPKRDCKACAEAATKSPAPASGSDSGSAPGAKIIDLPTEKLHIARLRDKISDKATTDKRFAEKAAFVLASWTSKKK